MLQLSLGISVTSLIWIVTHFTCMQLLFLCYCYSGATSAVYVSILILLKR